MRHPVALDGTLPTGINEHDQSSVMTTKIFQIGSTIYVESGNITSGSIAEISLYNLRGTMVAPLSPVVSAAGKISANVPATLAAGRYIAQVQCSGETIRGVVTIVR